MHNNQWTKQNGPITNALGQEGRKRENNQNDSEPYWRRRRCFEINFKPLQIAIRQIKSLCSLRCFKTEGIRLTELERTDCGVANIEEFSLNMRERDARISARGAGKRSELKNNPHRSLKIRLKQDSSNLWVDSPQPKYVSTYCGHV